MLFRSIRLTNFVIHRDTTVPLDRAPVLLVTGSNGSGKTLLLDALLLAIGVDSRRAQRQRNAAFIGRFGKYADVTIELNNFRVGNRRVLRNSDGELGRLLDRDVVTIGLRIHPNNTITYSVNERQSFSKDRISRQDIRGLFQATGLFDDTPVAVTEAETLDQFASQTPRRKFETLLSETGLKDWMEKLEDARLLVTQARANVTPLQHRIRTEEQRLQVLKAAYEAYEQKQRLQERLQSLGVEAAWAEVVYREELAAQLETTTSELSQRLNLEREKLTKLNVHRSELDARRKRALGKRDALRERIATLRDQQMQARGQREVLEREANLATAEITRHEQSKVKPGKTSAAKEETIRGEVAKLTAERDKLDDQLNTLGHHIAAAGEEVAAEPPRLPRREEEILRACQQFRQQLDAAKLNRPVLGPVFTLVRMKRGYEQHETAVKLALGRFTYAFLALDREGFRQAKTLFDRLWPHDKPNLLVARLDTETPEFRQRAPVKAPILGWAADLIQGDPYAVAFLSRVVNTAIAEATADPNRLADAAQQLGGNIITSDGGSYYLRVGAFTRPPAPVNVPLGLPLAEVGLSHDKLDLRQELRELRQEESNVMRNRARLDAEIGGLRSRLQDFAQQRSAVLSEADHSTMVANLVQRVGELHPQIAELDRQITACNQESQECTLDLTPVSSRLQTLEERLHRLDSHRSRREADNERLTRELQERENEQEHLLDQLKAQRETAQQIGLRPEKVRAPNEVRDELLQVQAMIQTIPATAADRQAYEEQEKLLGQLHEYLEQRRHHLDNLMTDVQRRLVEWRRHLDETIETLNHRMNQLLSHFLKQVRLTVRHPDEPSRAELGVQMAIDRQGAWRTYENMSGGERVLGTQTFILALHTLTKSPFHLIDEFTQRLDEASRAAVLSVVQRAVDVIRENLPVEPQFLLMAPSTVGLRIPPTMHHVVLVKGEVEH
jgi:chromosome segregation ATPase